MIRAKGIKMLPEEILARCEDIYNEVDKHTITLLLDNKPCAVSVIGKDCFDELQVYLNPRYWAVNYMHKNSSILETLFDKALLVTDGTRWVEFNGCSLPDLRKMINIRNKDFMGNYCTKTSVGVNKCLNCAYCPKGR
jgi:hypothetical protein